MYLRRTSIKMKKKHSMKIWTEYMNQPSRVTRRLSLKTSTQKCCKGKNIYVDQQQEKKAFTHFPAIIEIDQYLKRLKNKQHVFSTKKIHKDTCVSPGGSTKIKIDHIMTDSTISNITKTVRSYRGVSDHLDHFLVKAEVQIKLPRK